MNTNCNKLTSTMSTFIDENQWTLLCFGVAVLSLSIVIFFCTKSKNPGPENPGPENPGPGPENPGPGPENPGPGPENPGSGFGSEFWAATSKDSETDIVTNNVNNANANSNSNEHLLVDLYNILDRSYARLLSILQNIGQSIHSVLRNGFSNALDFLQNRLNEFFAVVVNIAEYLRDALITFPVQILRQSLRDFVDYLEESKQVFYNTAFAIENNFQEEIPAYVNMHFTEYTHNYLLPLFGQNQINSLIKFDAMNALSAFINFISNQL